VVIRKDQWPDSAQALLSVLFDTPYREPLLQEQAVEWLQSALSGNHLPIPAKLEETWNWKEARACFLIQRERAEHPYELPVWQ
ncbi:hypothetical protein MXD63_45825, partial [Frankia sp. Cpl3]|nr:hypothetical protein [Frankia sp. Cpl3]